MKRWNCSARRRAIAVAGFVARESLRVVPSRCLVQAARRRQIVAWRRERQVDLEGVFEQGVLAGAYEAGRETTRRDRLPAEVGLARQYGAAFQLIHDVVLLFEDGPNEFLPGVYPQSVEDEYHGLLPALGVPVGLQHPRDELVGEDHRGVGLVDPLHVSADVEILEPSVRRIHVLLNGGDALIEFLLGSLPSLT